MEANLHPLPLDGGRMLRSIGAVLGGFLVFTTLALGASAALEAAVPGAIGAGGRMESTPLLLIVLAYVFVFIVMGAYVTARSVRARPMLHAICAGGLMLAINIVSAAAMWDAAPAWYHAVLLVLVLPAAWYGGRLREREIASHGGYGRTIPIT
jgi:hypothetical protein